MALVYSVLARAENYSTHRIIYSWFHFTAYDYLMSNPVYAYILDIYDFYTYILDIHDFYTDILDKYDFYAYILDIYGFYTFTLDIYDFYTYILDIYFNTYIRYI